MEGGLGRRNSTRAGCSSGPGLRCADRDGPSHARVRRRGWDARCAARFQHPGTGNRRHHAALRRGHGGDCQPPGTHHCGRHHRGPHHRGPHHRGYHREPQHGGLGPPTRRRAPTNSSPAGTPGQTWRRPVGHPADGPSGASWAAQWGTSHADRWTADGPTWRPRRVAACQCVGQSSSHRGGTSRIGLRTGRPGSRRWSAPRPDRVCPSWHLTPDVGRSPWHRSAAWTSDPRPSAGRRAHPLAEHLGAPSGRADARHRRRRRLVRKNLPLTPGGQLKHCVLPRHRAGRRHRDWPPHRGSLSRRGPLHRGRLLQSDPLQSDPLQFDPCCRRPRGCAHRRRRATRSYRPGPGQRPAHRDRPDERANRCGQIRSQPCFSS